MAGSEEQTDGGPARCTSDHDAGVAALAVPETPGSSRTETQAPQQPRTSPRDSQRPSQHRAALGLQEISTQGPPCSRPCVPRCPDLPQDQVGHSLGPHTVPLPSLAAPHFPSCPLRSVQAQESPSTPAAAACPQLQTPRAGAAYGQPTKAICRGAEHPSGSVCAAAEDPPLPNHSSWGRASADGRGRSSWGTLPPPLNPSYAKTLTSVPVLSSSTWPGPLITAVQNAHCTCTHMTPWTERTFPSSGDFTSLLCRHIPTASDKSLTVGFGDILHRRQTPFSPSGSLCPSGVQPAAPRQLKRRTCQAGPYPQAPLILSQSEHLAGDNCQDSTLRPQGAVTWCPHFRV